MFYITIGIFLAMGFDINAASNNVLNAIIESGLPPGLSKASVGMFSFVMLLPTVPFNFIVSKNNLVQNKVVPEWIAKILSFYVPFLLSIPLLRVSDLSIFQSWTSLIFISACNFMIPFLLYFKCIEFRKQFNEHRSNYFLITVLTKRQLDLLFEIHFNSDAIREYIESKKINYMANIETLQLINHPPTYPIESGVPVIHIISSNDSSYSANDQTSESRPVDFSNSPLSIHIPLHNRSKPVSLLLDIPSRAACHERAKSVSLPLSKTEYEALKDSAQVSLRTPYWSSVIDVSFVDPSTSPIAEFIDHDVPDPDIEQSELVAVISDETMSAEACPNWTKQLTRTGRSVSHESQVSRQSLPRHPEFRTPPFRSVPRWIKIKPVSLARFVMWISIIFTALNIAFSALIGNVG